MMNSSFSMTNRLQEECDGHERKEHCPAAVCARGFAKRDIVFGTYSARSTMQAREGLVLGILLLLTAAILYAFSGAVVTVYTVWSDSYWTYYEFQHNIHQEYQCGRLGTGPLCTFFYYLTRGGAGALSLAGVATVAVSFYRVIEGPRTLPASAAPLGSCPKCGTPSPSTGKHCSECATNLT